MIVWCRLEKVKLSCMYSKVKIAGTLLCVAGALTMSIMHSAKQVVKQTSVVSSSVVVPTESANVLFDKEKIIGCLYLMAAVFVLSINVVLQAATLGDLPAPMSLCAITSFIGVVLTVAVQMFQNHKLETGWPLLSVSTLIAYSLLVIIIHTISLNVQKDI